MKVILFSIIILTVCCTKVIDGRAVTAENRKELLEEYVPVESTFHNLKEYEIPKRDIEFSGRKIRKRFLQGIFEAMSPFANKILECTACGRQNDQSLFQQMRGINDPPETGEINMGARLNLPAKEVSVDDINSSSKIDTDYISASGDDLTELEKSETLNEIQSYPELSQKRHQIIREKKIRSKRENYQEMFKALKGRNILMGKDSLVSDMLNSQGGSALGPLGPIGNALIQNPGGEEIEDAQRAS